MLRSSNVARQLTHRARCGCHLCSPVNPVAGNKFLIELCSRHDNTLAVTPILWINTTFQIFTKTRISSLPQCTYDNLLHLVVMDLRESASPGLFRRYPTICPLYQNLFPAKEMPGYMKLRKVPAKDCRATLIAIVLALFPGKGNAGLH